MKKNILIAMACLFAGFLQAQDTLCRVDGTRQIVRIIEVNPAQVRYIPFSDPDGPIYVLSKQAVARIIYEKGTVESFQAIREPGETPAVIQYLEPFNRNILSVYVVDILLGAFTVSYEQLTKSGKWGLKIPVSIGFLKLSDYYYTSIYNFYNGVKIFSLSPALNLYPFGQERITYYAGLSFLYGRNKYTDYDYYLGRDKNITGSFISLTLNNGAFIPLSNNIIVSGQLGIGLGKVANEHTTLVMPVEINICYKF